MTLTDRDIISTMRIGELRAALAYYTSRSIHGRLSEAEGLRRRSIRAELERRGAR